MTNNPAVYESRFWASEIPIGNPFDHELRFTRTYEMPFAAIGAGVLAAAGTIGTAATVGVGVAGGVSIGALAGAVVSLAATAAMVVGTVMTIVGAITGDTELMKIGGWVGLAGGVGAIASAALAPAVASLSSATAVTGTTAAVEQAITPALANAAPTLASGTTGTLAAAAETAIPTAAELGYSAAPALAETAASTAPSIAASAAPAITPALGTVGAAGAQAVESAMPVAAPTGIGANLAPTVPFEQSSFFGYLKSPQGILEIGKLGAGALQGMAEANQTNATMDFKDRELNLTSQFKLADLQLAQNNQQYTQMANERAYQNANSPSTFSLSAQPVTQAQRDAAKLHQAQLAKQQAGILTAAVHSGNQSS